MNAYGLESPHQSLYKERRQPSSPEAREIAAAFTDEIKIDEYLSLHSGLFSTLELNHTYYGIPKAANLEKMLVTGGCSLVLDLSPEAL